MLRSTARALLRAFAVAVVCKSLVAAPVTVDIEANVSLIVDHSGLLGGAISVGDIVTGSYTYESSIPDSNPLSTVGDYWHSDASHGIQLQAGPFQFLTDPTAVNFIVEIANDHGSPTSSDNYLLRSYSNVANPPLPSGAIVEHISWQLDDFSQTAVYTTALPTLPPHLPAWTSSFGLDIRGKLPGTSQTFLIRAEVESAVLRLPQECVTVEAPDNDPTGGLRVVQLGDVKVTAGFCDLSLVDFFGDGRLGVSIPCSESATSPPATIHTDSVCPKLPTRVDVRILTDIAELRAFGSDGLLKDTATAAPIYHEQILTVESTDGIERIEVLGSQMVLYAVCWSCADDPNDPNDPNGQDFRRADPNADGVVDMADGINLLGFLFLGNEAPSCMDAADTDGNGELDMSDAVAIFSYLFVGGKPPAAPGPMQCGPNAGQSKLGCKEYSLCE